MSGASADAPAAGRAAQTRGWWHLSVPADQRFRGTTARIEAYEEFGGPGIARSETPMLAVPLILTFGGGFAVSDGPRRDDPLRPRRSFVAGLHRGPARVLSSGDARCLQVDLTPQAAVRILRYDLADLADRTVDLADVIGAEGHRLERRLEGGTSWADRITVLEEFLAERLADADPTPTLADFALREIARSNGAARIAGIAARAACSRKHLSRTVRRLTGLSPKTLARIARFEHAVQLMDDPQEASLAGIAAAAGYADQAHFCRDFRSLSGLRPAEFPRGAVAFLIARGRSHSFKTDANRHVTIAGMTEPNGGPAQCPARSSPV